MIAKYLNNDFHKRANLTTLNSFNIKNALSCLLFNYFRSAFFTFLAISSVLNTKLVIELSNIKKGVPNNGRTCFIP